eukprot:s366_g39.t1
MKCDAIKDMVGRLYLHGPGGSGKTFMLNRIIIPVYEEYLPGTTRGLAAQNSAARLIGGATFHYMAGLGRGDLLRLDKPDKKRLASMQQKWRRVLENTNVKEFLENVFGNILRQICAGDHLQLNPVLEQSLISAFGISVPGAPTYERMEADKRQNFINVDQHGYAVLRSFLGDVVLFRGSHRFKQGDPLAELLETMRVVGGRPLSEKLKAMEKQIYNPTAGHPDPRLDSNFKMVDESGKQVGLDGFFARSVFSAVNWDQVARLQQLVAFESARAANRLLYYVQAVDLVHQSEFSRDQSILRDILRVTSMASKTGNLMSFLPLHEGLKVKVTKKLLPPEIVQECPAEIVAIQFHPEERFGVPRGPAGGVVPGPKHRCWESGYVLLNHLPVSITEVASQSEATVLEALKHLPKYPRGEQLPAPCGRSEQGVFLYEKGAWEAAVGRAASRDHGPVVKKRRKYDPTLWNELREELCRRRTPRATVFNGVPTVSWNDRRSVAQGLRKVVGRHVRSWEPQVFLDFVVTCIHADTSGARLEQWSAVSVVKSTCFGFLLDAHKVWNVEVIGQTSLVRFDDDGTAVRNKRVGGGVAALQRLQQSFSAMFEEMGNKHWATDMDVMALGWELQLGFLLAGNEVMEKSDGSGAWLGRELNCCYYNGCALKL